MTAPSPPRPDEPVPLSGREQRVFAAIENEFRASELARVEDRWTSVRLWVPAWPGWLSLLLVTGLLGMVGGSLHTPVASMILAVFVIAIGVPAVFCWFVGGR
ncbi:hypothetical protein BKA01_007827 [Pseudonocardia eucalypti]|nr:hypothetical protein [Pseudonocardia eucalypti]